MITILLLSSSQSSTSLPKSDFDILLISTGGVVGDSEDEDEGCDISESFTNTSPGIELPNCDRFKSPILSLALAPASCPCSEIGTDGEIL